MNRSFVIRLTVDTPIILRSLLHLDGLIGAMLTARGGRMEDLPLVRKFGAWQGSAALLETGTFGFTNATNTRIKHIRESGVPDGLFDHLTSKKLKIDDMHPMRNSLTHYSCLEGIRAAWFVGRGNLDATMDYLADVQNLGAMAHTGWGRVTTIEALEVDDTPLSGLQLKSGLPARTMTLETWHQIRTDRPEGSVIAMGRPAPPYWFGAEMPCISPHQRTITGTARELAVFTGAKWLGEY